MSLKNDQINDEEVQEILNKLSKLKENKDRSPQDFRKYEKYQIYCLDKLKYLITMRTKKYKGFSNYEDLNQDGFIALLSALDTYRPEKGSFFWWAHKYIDTKISRQANKHITVKVPLKKAKVLKAIKVDLQNINSSDMESSSIITDSISQVESRDEIIKAFKSLTDQKRKIIELIYGFDGAKPQTIEKVAKTLKISKNHTALLLKQAKEELKNNLNY